VITDNIIDYYNNKRLHSSINLLRPVDYYKGDPEKLLEERRVKQAIARHIRRKKLAIKTKINSFNKARVYPKLNLLEMVKSPTLS